ncbi:MAG: hypothetical protein IPK12_03795 [Gemmatimonadetes bacterium]|nr:hypothetical protein [Gemmatimonadota bacterium]
MSAEAVALVRESWGHLAPQGTALATATYAQLFALEPQLEARAAGTDRAEAARTLAGSIAVVVDTLDEPEALVAYAALLGRETVSLGFTRRDYVLFGDALLTTLQAALEPAWSQALHDAWVEAYTLVVSIMRRAGDRISGEFAPGLPPAP